MISAISGVMHCIFTGMESEMTGVAQLPEHYPGSCAAPVIFAGKVGSVFRYGHDRNEYACTVTATNKKRFATLMNLLLY